MPDTRPSPDLRQRLLRGAQAQAAGLAVRLIVQVGLVAVLAGAWGLDLYGEWLVLAAVPLYLTVSDIGLFVAGSNAMIMKVAENDRDGALAIFRAVSTAVGCLFLLVTVVLVVVVVLAPVDTWLNLHMINESTAGLILVVLGLNTLVASFAQVLHGGFASEGRYGEAQFIDAGINVIEFCAIATVVLLGGGPGLAATSMLATRLPCTAAMYFVMHRYAPWVRFGTPANTREVLRPLISPALASGAFPAGLALNLQGMVIMVGVVLGPASAAIFSTLRMVSRIIIQVLARVFAVITPELSRAFAEGEVNRMRSIHRHGCQAAIWLAAPILAVLAIFGDPIIRIWTSGAVDPSRLLLYMFLAVAALDAVWFTSLAVVFARNRHQRLAIYYVSASAISLVVGYVFLKIWGLDGAAASLVLFEAFMLVVTLREVLPAAHDTLRGWLVAVARPPPLRSLPEVLRPRPKPAAGPSEV